MSAKIKNNWVYFGRVGVNLAKLNPNRPRLDQDAKRAWIDALWGGFYKQGTGFLWSIDNTFCCLGVKQKLEDFNDEDLNGIALYFGDDRNVLGLRGRIDQEAVTFEGLEKGDELSLAVLNDRGASFREIAFVIEQVF